MPAPVRLDQAALAVERRMHVEGLHMLILPMKV